MLGDLFNFFKKFILEPFDLGVTGSLMMLCLLLPILLALFVAWGDWKSVLIGCLVWYGGLSVFALIEIIQGSMVLESAIIAFFFSIVGLPLLSVAVKITRTVLRRRRQKLFLPKAD